MCLRKLNHLLITLSIIGLIFHLFLKIYSLLHGIFSIRLQNSTLVDERIAKEIFAGLNCESINLHKKNKKKETYRYSYNSKIFRPNRQSSTVLIFKSSYQRRKLIRRISMKLYVNETCVHHSLICRLINIT